MDAPRRRAMMHGEGAIFYVYLMQLQKIPRNVMSRLNGTILQW